jgi:hypothetical protein
MCIRRETLEKARQNLAFSPFLSLIHILPICFDSAQVLYIYVLHFTLIVMAHLAIT